MLIVLAAGWVIVRSQAAKEKRLYVCYIRLCESEPAQYTRRAKRAAPPSAPAPPNGRLLREFTLDEIPRVGGGKLHRHRAVEHTGRGAGGSYGRVDAGARRRQR